MERIYTNASIYLTLQKALVVLVSALFLGPHLTPFSFRAPCTLTGVANCKYLGLCLGVSQLLSVRELRLCIPTSPNKSQPMTAGFLWIKGTAHPHLQLQKLWDMLCTLTWNSPADWNPLCTVGTFHILMWLTGFLPYPLYCLTGAF